MARGRKILLAALSLTAAVCALGLGWYFVHGWMARREFSFLAQTVAQAEQTETPDALAQAYDGLRQQNPDFGAWLTIENTRVDYPVMYTPAEPEKYLRRSFDGKYSMAGTPFLYAGCRWTESSNLVIYGHNMQSGDMFADLMNYLDAAYFEQHSLIQLDLPGERRTYRVMAVVPFEITAENEPVYYQCTNAAEEDVFLAYVDFLKQHAAYDTGVTAQYGEQLLTLSTCSEYVPGPGRLLIVARLEEKQPYS